MFHIGVSLISGFKTHYEVVFLNKCTQFLDLNLINVVTKCFRVNKHLSLFKSEINLQEGDIFNMF